MGWAYRLTIDWKVDSLTINGEDRWVGQIVKL